MEQFTSRTIAKLFDDVGAGLDDVQSIRTRTVKVMRFLDAIHASGWKLVPAEPLRVEHRDEPAQELEDAAT
ncbi:MAG TPA: hypothetical protein VHU21_26725 [Paraburkholderia sp.]|jgi:hypothetical protein|nr:hypothetical protein [Paraburkholderia sp.]HEX3383371.1 hypothetical protein [Paraburkholderia sp.]